MPFIETPLDVRKVGDNTWQLLAPVVYRGDYGTYTVPGNPEGTGYVTDFASVPRLMWTLFPQSGRWDQAAVVHDYLITDVLTTGRGWVTPRGTYLPTSAQVDHEFRGALKALKVGPVRRWLMWAGVRWAAALNPVRRHGWLRTLPLLLAVTASALAPFVAVALLLI
jgi:hypothetical protein